MTQEKQQNDAISNVFSAISCLKTYRHFLPDENKELFLDHLQTICTELERAQRMQEDLKEFVDDFEYLAETNLESYYNNHLEWVARILMVFLSVMVIKEDNIILPTGCHYPMHQTRRISDER